MDVVLYYRGGEEMKFYTIKEVADIFRCHPETVRRLIWTKKIKGTKVGGSWKISEDEVENHIKKRGN